MAIVKPTQAGVNRKLHRLSELKAKLDSISVLEAGKDTEFWKVLKGMLEESVTRHNITIDGLLDADELPSDIALGALKRNYGYKIGANAVLSLLEKPDEVREQYRAQIKLLEDDIKSDQDSGILEPQGA